MAALALLFAVAAFADETALDRYVSSDLSEHAAGIYIGRVARPEKGWTAYFVELTYPSGGKYPFKFTTAVRVTPDTEPFPAYQTNPEKR